MTRRIVAFGGYDTRKPRVRLLIDAIRRAEGLEANILIPAWEKVAQTNIPTRLSVLKVLFRIALGYPRALIRLARSHRGAAVLLPYPGIVEILVVAPICRLMGRKVVLDAFLPIHDTIVGDRALVKRGMVSWAIWWFEKIALGCADVILVDTDSHGDYFAREFALSPERFVTVLVGAEEQFTPALAQNDLAQDILGPIEDMPIVLFYGQLIPLHGLTTILEAARLARGTTARWVVIGKGQQEPLVQGEMDRLDSNIEWIEWVDYERLPAVIARASLCLGVFGTSDKAARVIPNKLFQQVAMGKPVITRASPAVDALAAQHPDAVCTVPADDPQALADAVAQALSGECALQSLHDAAIHELSPDAGVERLLEKLSSDG